MFVGTFNAGKLDVRVKDGRLQIFRDGICRKFVEAVEHRTFGGRYASERQQPVLYITERCVFRLTRDGLELVEIAPGVDLQRDIVSQMGFAPIMRTPPRLMDARIFEDLSYGPANDAAAIENERTFQLRREEIHDHYFEGHKVATPDDVEAIRAEVERALSGAAARPHAIVNYDNFSIAETSLTRIPIWLRTWSTVSTPT